MWMLVFRLERHQIHHIDYPYFQFRKMLPENLNSCNRFKRVYISRAGHHHIRLKAFIVTGPFPDAQTDHAMFDRRIHIEPLHFGLFSGHNYIDIISASQAMVSYRKQCIGIWLQINADNFCCFIGHNIQEPRILMAISVMILSPYMGCQQIIQRRNWVSPGQVP